MLVDDVVDVEVLVDVVDVEVLVDVVDVEVLVDVVDVEVLVVVEVVVEVVPTGRVNVVEFDAQGGTPEPHHAYTKALYVWPRVRPT